MKFNKIIPATALAVLASTSTFAAEPFAGVNFSNLEYSDSGSADGPNQTAIIGRAGVKFNDYFAVEVRGGRGSHPTKIANSAIELDLDNMYGAYFRLGYSVDDAVFPYAIAGYTKGEVIATAQNGFLPAPVSYSAEESGASFGLGLDLNLAPHFTLNFEYMRYLDKDGVDVSGPSAGIAFRF